MKTPDPAQTNKNRVFVVGNKQLGLLVASQEEDHLIDLRFFPLAVRLMVNSLPDDSGWSLLVTITIGGVEINAALSLSKLPWEPAIDEPGADPFGQDATVQVETPAGLHLGDNYCGLHRGVIPDHGRYWQVIMFPISILMLKDHGSGLWFHCRLLNLGAGIGTGFSRSW